MVRFGELLGGHDCSNHLRTVLVEALLRMRNMCNEHIVLNLLLLWQQSVALFNELWKQKLIINDFNHCLQ